MLHRILVNVYRNHQSIKKKRTTTIESLNCTLSYVEYVSFNKGNNSSVVCYGLEFHE